MLLNTLREDRALAIVRARHIDDAVALCSALTAGGIRTVEFTFTTPRVERIIAEAVKGDHGAVIGAGTVIDARSAESAIAAGAQFLVTPGISESAVAVAHAAGVPVLVGAFTPSEVMRAFELGAAAVKLFPASVLGAAYVRDLRGPFPDAQFVPSGGLHAGNAREWLECGALAVTAGSSVVSAADVEEGSWDRIAVRAAAFTAALNA